MRRHTGRSWCASNSSKCVDDTPCCFGINCNLPGKPYGTCAFQPLTCGCGSCPSTCAFTPQTCGCASASNCTQPS
nr:unnamed protein product [Digitaria exilis]